MYLKEIGFEANQNVLIMQMLVHPSITICINNRPCRVHPWFYEYTIIKSVSTYQWPPTMPKAALHFWFIINPISDAGLFLYYGRYFKTNVNGGEWRKIVTYCYYSTINTVNCKGEFFKLTISYTDLFSLLCEVFQANNMDRSEFTV